MKSLSLTIFVYAPVEDLGCLTCLLQSMAKIVQEEIATESKFVRLLLHLGIGSH